jgi:hypothetical protein
MDASTLDDRHSTNANQDKPPRESMTLAGSSTRFVECKKSDETGDATRAPTHPRPAEKNPNGEFVRRALDERSALTRSGIAKACPHDRRSTRTDAHHLDPRRDPDCR